MKYSSLNRGFPAGNPIANIFVIIVGALTIGASIVLGFFAFLIVGGIVLILASIIGLRLWWFRHTLQRGAKAAEPTRNESKIDVIEGEFQVVAEDDEGE